jgi:hypothetical protein
MVVRAQDTYVLESVLVSAAVAVVELPGKSAGGSRSRGPVREGFAEVSNESTMPMLKEAPKYSTQQSRQPGDPRQGTA